MKSQKIRNQDCSYYLCLKIEGSGSRTNGSGSGRPKKKRIRIRNTATTFYREKIMRRVPRKLAWRPACQLEWREWRPLPWPHPYRPAPPRTHERPGPRRTQKTLNVSLFSNVRSVNHSPPGGGFGSVILLLRIRMRIRFWI
jgi:hypothetical protein